MTRGGGGGGGAGGYLVGVVGGGAAALDAVRGHHGSQVVSLHQQLVQALAALLVDVDDGSGHLGDALDHHLQGGGSEVRIQVATPQGVSGFGFSVRDAPLDY